MNFNKQKIYSLIKSFYNKINDNKNSEEKTQSFILNNTNFEELYYNENNIKKLVLNNINNTSPYSFNFIVNYDENSEISSFIIECTPNSEKYKTLTSNFEKEDISSFFMHMTLLIMNIENEELKQNTFQFISQKNITV